MTQMIPTTINSTVRSGAERRLFKIIRDAPDTDHWVCLHSLGLARHQKKRRAEIDFVLLTHHGVFALEVKGGRIKCENGVWCSVDHYGQVHRKKESPFEQAASAMFALEKATRDHFKTGLLTQTLFGYGVIAPDVNFSTVGADGDRELIYDTRDRVHPFTAYIERLGSFTRSAQAGRRRGLTKERIADLVSFLRGDFVLVPDAKVVIDDTRLQLDELTKEQSGVLDALRDYPRVMVDGGAGSGKTVLAIRTARRLAKHGDRVLFLCYNKLLASRLRVRMASEQYAGELVVRHLDGHFEELIDASSLSEEFESKAAKADATERFNELFPLYAGLAASESDSARYDAIVIDEAQDFLTERRLEALDEMVVGGLESGRWRVFLDSENQAALYERMEAAAVDRLRQLSVSHALTVNCRNTRQIAADTASLSGSKKSMIARVDGPPVEFISYRRETGWIRKLESLIQRLRKQDVSPGRISILTPHNPSEQELKVLERLGIISLTESDTPLLGTPQLEHITWSTVSGFKGLENDVVILAGVKDARQRWWRAVVYVGMSRARSNLHVILEEECNKARQRNPSGEHESGSSDIGALL